MEDTLMATDSFDISILSPVGQGIAALGTLQLVLAAAGNPLDLGIEAWQTVLSGAALHFVAE